MQHVKVLVRGAHHEEAGRLRAVAGHLHAEDLAAKVEEARLSQRRLVGMPLARACLEHRQGALRGQDQLRAAGAGALHVEHVRSGRPIHAGAVSQDLSNSVCEHLDPQQPLKGLFFALSRCGCSSHLTVQQRGGIQPQACRERSWKDVAGQLDECGVGLERDQQERNRSYC